MHTHNPISAMNRLTIAFTALVATALACGNHPPAAHDPSRGLGNANIAVKFDADSSCSVQLDGKPIGPGNLRQQTTIVEPPQGSAPQAVATAILVCLNARDANPPAANERVIATLMLPAPSKQVEAGTHSIGQGNGAAPASFTLNLYSRDGNLRTYRATKGAADFGAATAGPTTGTIQTAATLVSNTPVLAAPSPTGKPRPQPAQPPRRQGTGIFARLRSILSR